MLSKPGPTLRSAQPFITLIKELLIAPLISNILIPYESICRTSAAIFIDLVTHFRRSLKVELGVILDAVLLKLLPSPTSSFMHKATALDVLRHLTRDQSMLASLFINYDCDSSGGADIFSQVVIQLERLLVKIAAPCPATGDSSLSHPTAWMTSSQQSALRYSALATLTSLLRCLRTFAQPQDATSSESAAHSAKAAANFLSQFEIRNKFQRGVALFNEKPEKGLKMLQADGFVGESSQEIAKFFHRQVALSKAKVGEFMGDERAFNIEVMTEYTNLLNFANLEFDAAIRVYLSGFRLPGEAQKIDRMMEKFAARYCSQNPSAFASTDGAFVLAFAVIMLNTDAHSSMVTRFLYLFSYLCVFQVKKKMTKEEFIRMNREIDKGQNVDSSFLSDIFDRIVQNEIKLKVADNLIKTRNDVCFHFSNYYHFSTFFFAQDEHVPTNIELRSAAGSSSIVSPKLRAQVFRKESDLLIKQALFSIRQGVLQLSSEAVGPSDSSSIAPDRSLFYDSSGEGPFLARVMFEMSWASALASLSSVINNIGIMLCSI